MSILKGYALELADIVRLINQYQENARHVHLVMNLLMAFAVLLVK